MEETLRSASAEGVRVLIVRAGDYFGPAAPNSGLGWTLHAAAAAPLGLRAGAFRRRTRLGLSSRPGGDDRAPPAPRRRTSPHFEVFHFRGHWLEERRLAASIRRVTGRPDLPVSAFPYPLLWALAPFVETFRELLEMRYLWRRPIGLDGRKLKAFLGGVPATPLDSAIRVTLDDMGLLYGEEPLSILATA